MNRRFRLTRSTDFKRVRRNGKSLPHPLVVLIFCPNDLQKLRIGVTASRSVGNAVARNRAKRRLRAAIAPYLLQIDPAFDVILIARKTTLSAPFSDLQDAVEMLLKKAGLL